MSRSRNAVSPLIALLAIGSVIGGANAKPPRRILAGELAPEGAFPAAVALYDPETSQAMCGGAIIGNRYILTAAHCVDGTNSYDVIIRAGANDIRNTDKVVERSISKIIVHPDFVKYVDGQQAGVNDLAVLVLKDDLPISESIQTTLLPNHQPELNVQYVLAGWGTSSPDSATAHDELQTLTLKLASAKKCRRFPPNMICAYSRTGSSCPGDSGSPLFNGNYVYGIVSTSHCKAERPAGLVNVYDYLDWILDTINNNI